MTADPILATLRQSDEPSIRWKLRCHVLQEDPASAPMRALQQEIGRSVRVRALLSHRDAHGRFAQGRGVYDKWQGAHWVLATLADLGYPPDDTGLHPARDQILDTWLAPEFFEEFHADRKADAYARRGVVIMQGRARRCASQQGYALYFLLRLGLENERIHALAERLLHWRWPDGGWNCDKEPCAAKSTFIHTIHCMRGLHLYGTRFGDAPALAAAREAAEIFLSRRLYKRRSDGTVMNPNFIRLHYPLYWHYDILFGLKVMAETGHLHDLRCTDALELLRHKRLADGGWPAEARYYSVSRTIKLNADFVDWSGVNKQRMNPWVTVDALGVLHAAKNLCRTQHASSS